MSNFETIKKKLRKVLQNNKIEQRKLSTQGRLECSRLAFYNTSGLIYSIPVTGTGKKYSATIILDISGSMRGEKIETAGESILRLVELFRGLIDFNIIVFGKTFTRTTIGKIKRGGDNIIEDNAFQVGIIKINGTPVLVRSYNGKDCNNEGTWSFAPVKQVLEDMRNKDGDRLVILITDGCDNIFSLFDKVEEINGISTKKYGLQGGYKRLSEEYEEAGVGLLSIGIGLKPRYLNSYYIEEADEIEGIIYEYYKEKYLKKDLT